MISENMVFNGLIFNTTILVIGMVSMLECFRNNDIFRNFSDEEKFSDSNREILANIIVNLIIMLFCCFYVVCFYNLVYLVFWLLSIKILFILLEKFNYLKDLEEIIKKYNDDNNIYQHIIIIGGLMEIILRIILTIT